MARRRRLRAPNDGGSIDQLPSGRWRLRVRPEDGKQVTYGIFDTEEEAFQGQARWRLTRLLPRDDPALAPELPVSVAVGGVRCDEWFERWQADKSARQSVVRLGRSRGGAASTAARDCAQWAKWWSPALGQALPHTVTADDIAGVLRSMEAAGRSPNTVRTHWVMVRAFFSWLVTTGVLDKSPAAYLSLSVDPAQDRVREIVVPDFVFLDLLYRQLATVEDRLIFELLLGTGGRRSEVAGMRIGDVDLAGKKVWVRQPVVEVEGKLVRSRTTKGGHARSVIIGPQLAAGLKEHIATRGKVGPDEPLFTSPEGGPIRWPNYIARRLRPAVESAATRWAALERRKLMDQGWSRADATAQALAQAAKLRKLTPHHLRHTAAALLWAAGVSDIEVQLILGHADIETSRRLYAHLLSGSAESAAARVEQLRQSRRSLGRG
ncbi:MAG TPA: tyrosine-type recombinase/integrase [Acidimicrobiales bacterium]|nr:tyrosine-type recombinase/integrase [Acidimicrobiales bacterium]